MKHLALADKQPKAAPLMALPSINPWERINVLNSEVWKGVNNLDLVVGEALDCFPLAGRVGKTAHLFYLKGLFAFKGVEKI